MEDTLVKNYGLVNEAPLIGVDYQAGVLDKKILMPSGQWDQVLPSVEYQKSYKTGFDSYGCVTFSCLNVLETLHKFVGIDKNFSDNFIAKMSGTIPGRGNSLRNVVECVRKGVVDESVYPFHDTMETFYQEIPQDVRDKQYTVPFGWEWGMGGDNLHNWHNDRKQVFVDLLKYSPVQITVYAYGKQVDGIYQPVMNAEPNHAIELYGYQLGKYWKVNDHYNHDKKKLHWEYVMSSPLIMALDTPVNLMKKYKGKLVKNANDNKVFFSNGEQFAWIKDEVIFMYGFNAGFWGYWDAIITIPETIQDYVTF